MPLLILSAKSSVDDRVRSLQAGGDDYLTKPFAFSELLARGQALIRRATQTAEPMKHIIGDLTMDLLAREVGELYQCVAEERKIALHTELPAQCEAKVDRNRIRQVFANLLDNAIKYTPEGGRVTITLRDEAGTVVAIFCDTGMGIPAEEQEKIWARLYRGDKSRSQRGLGLRLVKAVVEAHGGKVTVASQANEGATFTVKLARDVSVA